MIERELGPEARRFYFFNSFFFKKLTEKAKRQPGAAKGDGPRGGMSQEAKAKADHERLMKWTKVKRGAGWWQAWWAWNRQCDVIQNG